MKLLSSILLFLLFLIPLSITAATATYVDQSESTIEIKLDGSVPIQAEIAKFCESCHDQPISEYLMPVSDSAPDNESDRTGSGLPLTTSYGGDETHEDCASLFEPIKITWGVPGSKQTIPKYQ